MSLEPPDFLRLLANTLDRIGVNYLVTGSTATSSYGEPRLTNDIDIVVDVKRTQIDGLCAAFPIADFYVSRVAIESAVREKGQFNILHPRSGLKADLMVASNSEFD